MNYDHIVEGVGVIFCSHFTDEEMRGGTGKERKLLTWTRAELGFEVRRSQSWLLCPWGVLTVWSGEFVWVNRLGNRHLWGVYIPFLNSTRDVFTGIQSLLHVGLLASSRTVKKKLSVLCHDCTPDLW